MLLICNDGKNNESSGLQKLKDFSEGFWNVCAGFHRFCTCGWLAEETSVLKGQNTRRSRCLGAGKPRKTLRVASRFLPKIHSALGGRFVILKTADGG